MCIRDRFQTAKSDRRITNDQIEELITIYKRYRHVFSDTPGKIKNFQCEIKFKETADFKKKSYPIAYSQKEAVRTEINRLIEEDIIEYSYSPYTNPIGGSAEEKWQSENMFGCQRNQQNYNQ